MPSVTLKIVLTVKSDVSFCLFVCLLLLLLPVLTKTALSYGMFLKQLLQLTLITAMVLLLIYCFYIATRPHPLF